MLYNSRIGRRTRRISDSKLTGSLRDRRRIADADKIEDDEDVDLDNVNLTSEELQDLLELLPYKDALIKIAKGEFEIEKVEEVDETEEADDTEEDKGGEEAEEDNFEEDENFDEEAEDTTEEDDFDDEDETEPVADSVIDAWSKRLKGNNK